MTDAEKEKIQFLRGEGFGYGAIAERLGISANTVKSFCRRNCLSAAGVVEAASVCRCCGRPLGDLPRGNLRKFCSEACRRAWWREHGDLVERRKFYVLVCAHCGKPGSCGFASTGDGNGFFRTTTMPKSVCAHCRKEFRSYGNKKRKYCSHACYIAERFRGRGDEPGAV